MRTMQKGGSDAPSLLPLTKLFAKPKSIGDEGVATTLFCKGLDMNLRAFLTVVVFFTLLTHRGGAATFYVDASNSVPVAPFATWSTAATNIQDAIDASTNGDTILVTNGVYQFGGTVMAGNLTNRVALNKPVTVQSMNGPWVTAIFGAGAINGNSAVRCAWLTNGAALVGFTLTQGATRSSGDVNGGGVWCVSSASLVSNCLIVSNTASEYGGGVYQGTVNSSLISRNNCYDPFGGASYKSVLNNCTIVRNAIYGVAYPVSMTNCIIYYNNSYGNVSGNGNTCSYCCTTPALAGTGNFTNAPQFFVDGIHLANGSPCIGAGTSVVAGTDIFGNAWSNPPSVGCAQWLPAPVLGVKLTFQVNSPDILTFNLAIAGQAPFACFWSKDGTLVQDDGHHSNSGTLNLVVNHFTPDDAGIYQLVVSNAFGVATSAVAQVVIHAVNVAGSNPVAPYATWATAATNIQDAINIAAAGDIVLVADGVYATGGEAVSGNLTNRVVLDRAVTVTSVNGYTSTVIQGAWDPIATNGPGAMRCAYLADGAKLLGFTLCHGATLATGDKIQGGPLESGGGVLCNSQYGIVANCVLSNNCAVYGGGIANGTLNNSLVTMNLMLAIYGGGGGAYNALLNNCTVVNNYATPPFPNVGAGTYGGIVRNSIVVNNFYRYPLYTSQDNGDYVVPNPPLEYFYCYTSVQTFFPPGSTNINVSLNNLHPQFLDTFHIASTSPCFGAGSALYASGTDLDGEPWGNPPSMGCDEVVPANLGGPLTVNVQAYQTNTFVNRATSFNGVITGRPSGIAWNFGDGITATNNAPAGHTWTNSGNYTVTFTAYNNDNPGGVSTNLTVFVVPLAVPQLQAPVMMTNGFQFQFAAQTNATYIVQYKTNLISQTAWQFLTEIYYSSGGVLQINDPQATNGMRFYRVWVQ